MENIAEKLNQVIDYIENHLTDEIDQDEIAKIACCSYYDVARMFSLIADISISDYIRKRRLTLAGAELKCGGAKVTDISLIYGYDSPISFSRAFKEFHGFNPSDADKKDMMLKEFPRLVYQICVKEIVDETDNETIQINGKSYNVSYLGEQDMTSWSEFAVSREFWRIKNGDELLKNCTYLTDVLPYNNYPPIKIEHRQIFVIDYHKKDGSVERRYYVADGTVWQGMQSTRQFVVKE